MKPVTVEIIETRGSAPRDTGTIMEVRADRITGTIGGGALEHRAIARAREMRALPFEEVIPLGPDLGQCCGGSVRLRYTLGARCADLQQFTGQLSLPEGWVRRPLWLWGAGHVGRAIVRQLAPLGAFDVTWVDSGAARFPANVPQGVAKTPATDMPALMGYAPLCAVHLIVTYSHEIDLALCHAALRRGFAFCGLIGSDTKWARFRHRLKGLGHTSAQIERIACPIGDKSLGKHPDFIAFGTAAQLLRLGDAPGERTI